MIVDDLWLGGVLSRPVFRVDDDTPINDAASHLAARGAGMWFTRVPCDDTRRLGDLTDLGFRVVDVNVILRRAPRAVPVPMPDGVVVADVTPATAEAVIAIGGSGFERSRFHLDPHISDSLADDLKREWTRNCVTGTRGVATHVALVDGQPAGFLSVIETTHDESPERVIDLVAVDAKHRGRGVGAALVDAFIDIQGSECASLAVGTQAANVASLRLYERAGFLVSETRYVMHRHAR
jgi:GNAT superfamily N-acetyltransferase